MLLIQTHNIKEQSSLEEEFSRDTNLFAIPAKKTGQIGVLMETIIFEIFGQATVKEPKLKHHGPFSPLIEKVKILCEGMLKFTLSLSLVREIFYMIKTQSTKIQIYEDYIKEMNTRIMLDDDLWGDHTNANAAQLLCLEDEFQTKMGKHYQRNQTIDLEFEDQDCRIETELIQLKDEDKLQNVSLVSIKCKFDESGQDDAQTMHTLKSEMTSKNQLSMSPLHDLHFLGKQCKSNQKLDNSFHSSESEKQNSNVIINVSEELKGNNRASCVFYCPEWKKNEDEKKKMVKSAIPQENKNANKNKNQSNYIENLSGKFQPVQSFLHEDSIGQKISKQKKEDVRKSNILKMSMQGLEENKLAMADQAYSSNLRLVKFHNKLKKVKKVNEKKVMDEIKQEFEEKQGDISEKTNKIVDDHKTEIGLCSQKEIEQRRTMTEKAKNEAAPEINANETTNIKKQQGKKTSGDAKNQRTVFNFFKARK